MFLNCLTTSSTATTFYAFVTTPITKFPCAITLFGFGATPFATFFASPPYIRSRSSSSHDYTLTEEINTHP